MRRRTRVGNGAAIARRRHVAHCFEAVRDLDEATATELAAATGLSRPTVQPILRALEAAGAVTAKQRLTDKPGRPGASYTFNPEVLSLACLDLDPQVVRHCIVDLAGQVGPVTERLVDEADVAAAGGLGAALLAKSDELLRQRGAVDVLVVSMPGVVTSEGLVVQATALPEWNGKSMRELLRLGEKTQLIVENHVNAAARAEAEVGSGAGVDDQIYVHIARGLRSPGLKTGIIVGGKLHRGARFAAGEGARLDQLGSGLDQGPLQIEQNQSAVAERLVGVITVWLSSLIGTLDPGLVVLGGPGSVLGREQLRHRLEESLPRHFTVISPPPLVLGELGSEASILGVAIMAVEAASSLLLEGERISLPPIVWGKDKESQ